MSNQNDFELFSIDPFKAQIRDLKSELLLLVIEAVERQSLSQKDAARLLKLTRPRMSNLFNGHVSKFSIDSLVEMLLRLGYEAKTDYVSRTPFVLESNSTK